ncbi:hypothetical protein IscW_ISCW016892 [Ixodes scapularis]|uniref:Uncharacterized protein n=1 Tax=Ixodes scapularis TaxID=6945 RepID=B7PB75_IXOSC|nr:hypothetical protein IscW_ISCW016892 [Ixodes scapularis]|eukprot:XP_002407715.1 hypothetical protein IscW_ISCW016892 [Ixodes scapularis]
MYRLIPDHREWELKIPPQELELNILRRRAEERRDANQSVSRSGLSSGDEERRDVRCYVELL